VNRAILQAHTDGIVTSSTLMANGHAFDEAVQLAISSSRLSIGCHVVLIDGEPILDASRLSTITDSRRFRDGLTSFAARALAGRMNAGEIQAEARAQMHKIQSAGITLSHVDTHKHTHIFPQILRPVLRAARECGVRAIRNPFGPRFPLRSSELLARPNLWKRFAEVRVLSRLARQFRRAVDQEGFLTPDGTLGIEVTGTLNESLFELIAQNIPDGTWEFVTHPGYNDADLMAAKTRLRESRELELQVLTLPRTREVLVQAGIQLISYQDFLNNA